MPVLGLGRNGNNRAGLHCHGLLAPLLIPSAASHTDKHLHGLMVDMPIVAAAGFKGYVDRTAILSIEGCEIAIANKILGIACVELALGPDVEIYICIHSL